MHTPACAWPLLPCHSPSDKTRRVCVPSQSKRESIDGGLHAPAVLYVTQVEAYTTVHTDSARSTLLGLGTHHAGCRHANTIGIGLELGLLVHWLGLELRIGFI